MKIALALVGMMISAPAFAASDAQIAQMIVRASRQAYYATGHPCACPYDVASGGSLCGRRSAYDHRAHLNPRCYIKDVPKAEIEAFRRRAR